MNTITYAGITVMCALLFAGCGMQNAGNTSETGNARATGKIYASDGKTPAAGVKVVVRDVMSLAGLENTVTNPGSESIDSAFTDKNGCYQLFALDRGSYVASAVEGNDGVLITPIMVVDTSVTLNLGDDTLRPLGVISGKLVFEQGGTPGPGVVLVFGVDRFTLVNADGTFTIPNLPAGTYTLKILPQTDQYETFTLDNIEVIEGKATDIGTLKPPFSGIPRVKGLAASFDTVKQLVTLTWEKVNHPDVIGYNVVDMRLPDMQMPAINKSLITDTFFIDTFSTLNDIGMNVTEFSYSVVTVDKNYTAGIPSEPLFVARPYGFSFEDRQFLLRSIDLCIASDSTLAVIGDTFFSVVNSRLSGDAFSTSYQFQPKKICSHDRSTFFLLTVSGAIYTININGDLIDTVIDSSQLASPAYDIEGINGNLFVLKGNPLPSGTIANGLLQAPGGDSILVYSEEGELLRSWQCDPTSSSRMLQRNSNGHLCVSCGKQGETLKIFDTLGNQVSAYTFTFETTDEPGYEIQRILGGIFDPENNRYYLHVIDKSRNNLIPGTLGALCVVDNNGALVTSYHTVTTENLTFAFLNNNLVSILSSNTISTITIIR